MSDHMAALQRVYAELLGRAPESAMAPRLDAVRMACDLLGDPQRAYPVILLTGTNGKTSTARMIERILREHNLRTGRYTSPHLHSVTERIAVDGVPLSPRRFVERYEDVAPYLAMVDGDLVTKGQPPITFFEILTVLAFAEFADAPVDVAVMEVGLGGSWDATNIADADVSVVMPIGLDHTAMLGDSIAEIAAEKAGIFRQGAPVVLAEQPDAAARVLLDKAIEAGCPVLREGPDFEVVRRNLAVGGQQLTIRTPVATYADVYLPLHGEHQGHNLATAITAVEAFLGGGRLAVDGEVLGQAVADAASPGRLEMVRSSPVLLVDAAHNQGGIESLIAALEEGFAFRHLVGLFGALADKDAGQMLELLEPVLDEIVISRSGSPRSIPVGVLGELATEIFGEDRVHVVERLDDAVTVALDLAEATADREGGVIATGSVTVAADVRLLAGAKPVDAEADRSLARGQEDVEPG